MWLEWNLEGFFTQLNHENIFVWLQDLRGFDGENANPAVQALYVEGFSEALGCVGTRWTATAGDFEKGFFTIVDLLKQT